MEHNLKFNILLKFVNFTKIRLENKGGRHSSIVFCTNGVLLRVLVSNSRSKREDISDITHIIMVFNFV